MSHPFIGLRLGQRNHYGAHAHRIEDADATDDEDERREDEWVPHHTQDVVVGEPCQQHVHEHWRVVVTKVMLKIKCLINK